MLPFENPLCNRQSQSITLRLLRIESVKQFKDTTLMLRGDTNSIVSNGVDSPTVFDMASNGDTTGPRSFAVLDSVVDEVREDLPHKCGIPHAIGKGAEIYLRIGLFCLELEGLDRAGKQLVHGERLDLKCDASKSGEVQEAGKQGIHFCNAGFDEAQSARNIGAEKPLYVRFLNIPQFLL